MEMDNSWRGTFLEWLALAMAIGPVILVILGGMILSVSG